MYLHKIQSTKPNQVSKLKQTDWTAAGFLYPLNNTPYRQNLGANQCDSYFFVWPEQSGLWEVHAGLIVIIVSKQAL